MDKNTNITLGAVGDISVGIGLKWRKDYLENSNVESLTNPSKQLVDDEVMAFLQRHDVLFGNLECVITESYYDDDFEGRLASPPELVDLLDDCGFDILNLANNHILDHGEKYVEETKSHLDKAGIQYIGDPINVEKPTTIEMGNHSMTFLGYNLFGQTNNNQMERIYDMVEKLSNRSGSLVISLHWGANFEHALQPCPLNIHRGRKLINSGADIILGHHTHSFQPVEYYRDGVIAYSLGNFIFYMWQKNNVESGVLTVDIREDKGYSVDVLPTKNKKGNVYAQQIDRIEKFVPSSVDEEVELEDYNKLLRKRKRKYKFGVFKEYIQNIHKFKIRSSLAFLTRPFRRRLR